MDGSSVADLEIQIEDDDTQESWIFKFVLSQRKGLTSRVHYRN